VSSVDLAALRESCLAFWQERKPRERTALGLGAAVAIVALLYALVFAPAIEGRQQLAKALPSLRQQASELQALSQESAQFVAGATAAPAPTKDTIERSLRDRGLKAQSIVVDGGLTRVQLTGVSFSSLLDWLTDAQQTARLTVVDAGIVAQPAADTVNATLTLRQQKNGSE
jgi:general secretion pathway protein M